MRAMFRPLPLYIGLRYTGAKRRNGFISATSFLSIGGLALSIIVLITVMSVMNGFEQELRDRILSMISHAQVSGPQQQLEDWQLVQKSAEENPEVVGAAPFVNGEGMLRAGKQLSGVILRGVYPELEPRVSQVHANMTAGKLSDLVSGEYGIVLGSELAAYLRVSVGDKVDLLIPQANITPAGVVPRFRRFKIVGTFAVGHFEYDRNTAIINIDDARKLLRMGDTVSGVRLQLEDMFTARKVATEVVQNLDGFYFYSDWTQSNANFFEAIRMEKTVMFIILSFIMLIVAVNIISTLVMVVTEKQADIAIMRTLGSTPTEVMLTFVVQGVIIGLLGTFIGVVLGVLLAVNVPTLVGGLESLLGHQFLNSSVYYISELPSKLEWGDVIRTCVLSFTLTVIAAVIPAMRAARIQPAEALRYE